MMKKLIYLLQIVMLLGCSASIETDIKEERSAKIFPDYSDVTLPSNIAPINMVIEEEGDRYYLEFIGGEGFAVTSKSGDISIPMGRWKSFREANQGEQFSLKIMVERDGKWHEYNTITNSFSSSAIDSHLVYRKIAPGYITWNHMGIYERDLTSFSETTIVDNTSNDKGCMNCHTFQHHSPDNMMLHVRKNAPGTVIKYGDEVTKVDIKVGDMIATGVYPSWHPSEKFIAYSVNSTIQLFHQSGIKPIDVVDSESDLVVYDIDGNTVYTSSAIYSKEYMETFPDWSLDGKHIYFARAPQVKSVDDVVDIKYDLCRISFDTSSRTFGDVEVMFDAASIGKSVSFPKSSPDGRYVVFTLADYGNFSVWHPEGELYIMDTKSGDVRILDELNSDDVDSYHSWSSDGKWLVLSSKRIDGLWSRPFFAEFDSESGRFSKPFLMPQKSANDYALQLYSYNIPNMITGSVSGKRAIRNAVSGDVSITGAEIKKGAR